MQYEVRVQLVQIDGGEKKVLRDELLADFPGETHLDEANEAVDYFRDDC